MTMLIVKDYMQISDVYVLFHKTYFIKNTYLGRILDVRFLCFLLRLDNLLNLFPSSITLNCLKAIYQSHLSLASTAPNLSIYMISDVDVMSVFVFLGHCVGLLIPRAVSLLP